MRKPATLGTILPPLLACGVGAILFAAYLAPFYGGLERTTAEDDTAIVTENFEMPENTIEDVPSSPPVASFEAQNTPLERVEPRAPLSELGLATPPQEKPAESILSEDKAAEGGLFYRPVALAAGRLEVGNRIIELNDIDIVEPETPCADINGEVWQCGMQARTAFRSWLRGRAVVCDMEGVDQEQQLIKTSCSLADTDIARWLVENGWARAKFGGIYNDSQAQAEKQLLGVFGRKPVTDVPTTADDVVPNPEMGLEVPAFDAQDAQPDLPFPPAPQ